MTKQKSKYILPILALILSQIFWGINTPVIKLGLQSVPLPVYHSVTMLGAALAILPFALHSWKPLKTKDYFSLIVGSIIAISLGNIALLLALPRVPAVNAPLIGLLGPVLMFILSVRYLKEKMSLKTLIGIAIALVGAAIIIGKPWEWNGSGQNILIGNLLLVLAVLCDVIGVMVCKQTVKHGSSTQVTFIHLFTGILPVAFFAIHYLPTLRVEEIGRTGFSAMAYNIVAVAAANALFIYGLKMKKMQEVGIYGYIDSVVTAFAAWVLLSEAPTTKIGLGALLIFLGIYLSDVRPLKKLKRQ